jgi:hypothetical protein
MNTDISCIEDRRALAGVGVHLRRVFCGVGVFVVCSLLLNAAALQRNASHMEYGFKREVCLVVIKPIASFSALLCLDRPREWVEQYRLSEGT